MSKAVVKIICAYCGKEAEKKRYYYNRRIRMGKTEFYCDRKCADKKHSERMVGKNNPNYGGEFHGISVHNMPEKEKQKVYDKISRIMIERGISKGKNNPRWAGGIKNLPCVMCGKPAKVRPYIYRQIQAGNHSPCCSVECAAAYARSHLKHEATSIEIKMAEELDKRKIEYIEQYNLGDKFALDFFIPEYNIVIECDGDYWHNLPDVKKRDKSKNAYIKACGFPLFRFWEHEINEDVTKCVDKIIALINETDAGKTDIFGRAMV